MTDDDVDDDDDDDDEMEDNYGVVDCDVGEDNNGLEEKGEEDALTCQEFKLPSA